MGGNGCIMGMDGWRALEGWIGVMDERGAIDRWDKHVGEVDMKINIHIVIVFNINRLLIQ